MATNHFVKPLSLAVTIVAAVSINCFERRASHLVSVAEGCCVKALALGVRLALALQSLPHLPTAGLHREVEAVPVIVAAISSEKHGGQAVKHLSAGAY